MAVGRHLWFDPTRNGTVRSAIPENLTLEPNTKLIGWHVAELWPFSFSHSGHRKPETGHAGWFYILSNAAMQCTGQTITTQQCYALFTVYTNILFLPFISSLMQISKHTSWLITTYFYKQLSFPTVSILIKIKLASLKVNIGKMLISVSIITCEWHLLDCLEEKLHFFYLLHFSHSSATFFCSFIPQLFNCVRMGPMQYLQRPSYGRHV